MARSGYAARRMFRHAGTRATSRRNWKLSAIASGSQWTSARWWKNCPAASMILPTPTQGSPRAGVALRSVGPRVEHEVHGEDRQPGKDDHRGDRPAGGEVRRRAGRAGERNEALAEVREALRDHDA